MGERQNGPHGTSTTAKGRFVDGSTGATLHLSCCWVPALVDVISVGTASTTYIPQSRNVFLILTILILAWSINRDGLSRRNVIRIALPISILQGQRIASLILNSTARGSKCH